MNRGMQGTRQTYFPGLEARAFWSFAAISPLSRRAEDAVTRWHHALAARGPAAFGEAIAAREALRAELAGLLGGEPGDYALTSGTTASVIGLARSFRWREQDGIVLFTGEFPTNVIPWEQAARDFGLRVVKLAAEDFRDVGRGIERLSSILKSEQIRLVACSAVEFQTGLALPIGAMAEVCHRHGALLAVDAIQAAGIVPMDFATQEVDFAVGGGHKWLLGLDGLGWVYASERGKCELGTAMAGWLSVVDGTKFLFDPDELEVEREPLPQPRVLESGSTSSAAVFATLEGVRLCREAGVRETFDWVQGLHDLVEGPLCELGFESERAKVGRSGILSFRPPPGVVLRRLLSALGRRGVILTIPDGRLRLAPHFCSNEGEARAIVEVMPECLAEAR